MMQCFTLFAPVPESVKSRIRHLSERVTLIQWGFHRCGSAESLWERWRSVGTPAAEFPAGPFAGKPLLSAPSEFGKRASPKTSEDEGSHGALTLGLASELG